MSFWRTGLAGAVASLVALPLLPAVALPHSLEDGLASVPALCVTSLPWPRRSCPP